MFRAAEGVPRQNVDETNPTRLGPPALFSAERVSATAVAPAQHRKWGTVNRNTAVQFTECSAAAATATEGHQFDDDDN